MTYGIDIDFLFRSQISKKRFMSGINTFVCIFGFTRAISLLTDPYGSRKVSGSFDTKQVCN